MTIPMCEVCYVDYKGVRRTYNQRLNLLSQIKDKALPKPVKTSKWKCPECKFRLTTRKYIN